MYAMKVDESVSMKEYGGAVRFSKKPPKKNGTPIQMCGDNAYRFKKKRREEVYRLVSLPYFEIVDSLFILAHLLNRKNLKCHIKILN